MKIMLCPCDEIETRSTTRSFIEAPPGWQVSW